MKKRVLAMILTLLLVVGLVPMTSSAISSINLIDVSSDRQGDGWYWNQEEQILTLTGVHVASIDLPVGSTIKHSGLNKIDHSIYSEGSLSFDGFGTIEAAHIYSVGDGARLVIGGGNFLLKKISAVNLNVSTSYINVKDDTSLAPVTVTGTFFLGGGYLRIENTGSGNGLEIDGLGAYIDDGFLEVIAKTAANPKKGAIYCASNEFVNDGGVVKAINKGQGPAMSNYTDAFAAEDGVTILKSEQGKAIVGKAYTDGDELAYDSLDDYRVSLKEDGFAVKRDEVLTGSEYVFCKMFEADIDRSGAQQNVVLDGLYSANSVGFSSNGNCKKVTIQDSCYASASGLGASALVINGDVELDGSGTFVCDAENYASGLTFTGNRSDLEYAIRNGALICISDEGAPVETDYSSPIHSISLDRTIMIAIARGADNCAIEAKDALRLENRSHVIAVAEGYTAALHTANLTVKNSTLTCYSPADNGIDCFGSAKGKDGSAVFENSSVSAVAGNTGYGLHVQSGSDAYVSSVTVKGRSSVINLYSDQAQGINMHSKARDPKSAYTPIELDGDLALLTAEALSSSYTDMTDQLKAESKDHVYQPHMLICGKYLLNTMGAEKYEEPAPQPEPVEPAEPQPQPEPEKPAEPQPQPEPEKPVEPQPQPEPEKPAEPEPQPEPEKPVKLTTPFKDVPEDAYYYDATVWAYNAEPQITDGNGKDKFMPEQICTRGQVVTFLWRAAGEPEPKSKDNPFTDVKSSDYFYKPVLWAVEQGITDGTSPDKFSPNNPCKNSHILTFIWRALGKPDDKGSELWYQDAHNWAAKNHLLDGTYTGSFDINTQSPRKNVVQYLYAYYNMK